MSKHSTQMQAHHATSLHPRIRHSTFFRNSTKKTTFNCGDLVPIYCDPILPGDTYEMDLAFLTRLSTPIFPTMDVLDLEFYAFFVPNRLVWDGWEPLMGENKSSAWVPQTSPSLVPQYGQTINPVCPSKSVGDYYGLPVDVGLRDLGGVSVLPFRGYGLIWNEWWRDQNMQAPFVVRKGNVEYETSVYRPWAPSLFKVNKKHDYFTSCLPAPQKGESALIPIELNELIPVITGDDRVPVSGQAPTQALILRNTFTGNIDSNKLLGVTTGGQVGTTATAAGAPLAIQYPSNLYADGRNIPLSASTISELRTAVQIQKLYERDARGGTRYVEMLKAHFGVDAQDYRLQRPEFLGSIKSRVGIHQVPQTSGSNISGQSTPQGNLAAFSYTSGKSSMFKKSFVEHGFLHIFAVARQPKSYQQGLERFWSARDRLDFPFPVLAHISEQPVYAKELAAFSNLVDNNRVFGYRPVFDDHRFKNNTVTGQMREGVPNSLHQWHYADYYNSTPYLSDSFIQDNSRENVDKTISVQSSMHDQIIADIAFLCKATRPLPLHGIPGFIDHF